MGIAEQLFDCIQKADIDTRPQFYSHIVLSGGSSMYPGLPTRLEKEIRNLYLDKVISFLSLVWCESVSTWWSKNNVLVLHEPCDSTMCTDFILFAYTLSLLFIFLTTVIVGIEGRQIQARQVQVPHWGPPSPQAHGVPWRSRARWNHEGQTRVLDQQKGVRGEGCPSCHSRVQVDCLNCYLTYGITILTECVCLIFCCSNKKNKEPPL